MLRCVGAQRKAVGGVLGAAKTRRHKESEGRTVEGDIGRRRATERTRSGDELSGTANEVQGRIWPR